MNKSSGQRHLLVNDFAKLELMVNYKYFQFSKKNLNIKILIYCHLFVSLRSLWSFKKQIISYGPQTSTAQPVLIKFTNKKKNDSYYLILIFTKIVIVYFLENIQDHKKSLCHCKLYNTFKKN